jgi:Papain-like cysteine protease AvrRpt2/LysM domain
MPMEKAPRNPVPRNFVPPGAVPYKVQNGDSWEKLARAHGLGVWDLIEANFKTRDPAEVNWYLHHYVGCGRPTPDGKNWMFDASANPGTICIPSATRIRYSVPMRRQGLNPICWVACVAMIASYKGRVSVGIGRYTGGFDPSNSSIPQPAKSMDDFYRLLSTFGFVTENAFPHSSPNAGYIEQRLKQHGPLLLMHFASDLLPGTFSPDATHAVVITGIDRATNQIWYNNPWGNVDEVATVDQILRAMERLLARNVRAVAYIP